MGVRQSSDMPPPFLKGYEHATCDCQENGGALESGAADPGSGLKSERENLAIGKDDPPPGPLERRGGGHCQGHGVGAAAEQPRGK